MNRCLRPASLFLFAVLSSGVQADLQYRFEWGRLDVVDMLIRAPLDQRPSLYVEATTVGALGKFFRYSGHALAQVDGPITTLALEGLDNGFPEHRVIEYSPDQPPRIVDFVDDEIPAPTIEMLEQLGPVQDPLSFLGSLMLADTSQPGQHCLGEHRLYDGKRLFEITLNAMGWETLGGARKWSWQGDAFRCEIDITRFIPASDTDNKAEWFQEDTETRILWLADLGAAQGVVPVQFSIPAPIGHVLGRLETANSPLQQADDLAVSATSN